MSGALKRKRLWGVIAVCALVIVLLPQPPPLSAQPTTFAISANGVATWDQASAPWNAYTLQFRRGTSGSFEARYIIISISTTSLDFKTASTDLGSMLCCVNGDTYSARIQTEDTAARTSSPWSAWVSFTFTGTSSFTATPLPAAANQTQTEQAKETGTAQAEGTETAVQQTADAHSTETAVQQTADAAATRAQQTADANATRDQQTADANATRNQQTADANATRDQATTNARGTINAATQSALDGTATRVQQTNDAQATIDRATAIALETLRGPQRGNGGGSSGPSRSATPERANLPIPTQDHSRLPAGAEVESDTDWIAFSEVSGAAISNPAVRNAALSAIDVWGPLGVQAEVCFDNYGSLLLLDTAYSPRRQVRLTSYLRADGKTCAGIDRAGTVVLLPGAPSATLTPSPRPAGLPPAPTANPYLIRDNPATARALSNCMVTSIDMLNFRDSPAGNIRSWYAGNAMALARTRNWFKVSYLGNEGWISAHFVTTSGDCG